MKYRFGCIIANDVYAEGHAPDMGRNRNNSPRPMEVWWVDMLRYGNGGGKGRPVVVLGTTGDRCTCLPCTSKNGTARMRLLDPLYAGLDGDSYVTLDPVSLTPNTLSHKLGTLCKDDAEELRDMISDYRSLYSI